MAMFMPCRGTLNEDAGWLDIRRLIRNRREKTQATEPELGARASAEFGQQPGLGPS